MPDWTYQTVFRPLLRRLPFATAQSLVFGSMGLLGRNPIGRTIVNLMGHAKPSPEVGFSRNGLTFPGRCGLACGVDLSAQAVSATTLFGFGLIEVGPLSRSAPPDAAATQWRDEGLAIAGRTVALDLDQLATALQRNTFRNDVPVIVQLLPDATGDLTFLAEIVEKLDGLVDGYSFCVNATDDAAELHEQCTRLRSKGGSVFGRVDVVDASAAKSTCDFLQSLPLDGIILQNGIDDDGARGVLNAEVVSELKSAVTSAVSSTPDQVIIASGGVEEPADALELVNAGADLVLVDSGFAVAGPGLPKRINAAVLSSKNLQRESAQRSLDDVPATQRSWFWAFLMGLSLTLGGVMVLIIGWTRVLLPYDEEFLDMLRDEICGINPQLLPFMSHDRVTLAGTMLSLGPLYLSLAWFGDRLGMHWARAALLGSAFVGFLSFFLFLGFGYFDPFHAFISALLFQIMTLSLRSSQPVPALIEFDLHNSPSWKKAMWGQLLMVIHGAGVLLAGTLISSFGVTSVFVADDLEFMQTTREALVAANPRLVPLVAHDRASFGGMLMATGVTVLLSALWGWQRGRRWLWYALTVSGTVAYATTIVIHWCVGYTTLRHLLPAYGGLMFLWLAMLMAKEWMFEDASNIEA